MILLCGGLRYPRLKEPHEWAPLEQEEALKIFLHFLPFDLHIKDLESRDTVELLELGPTTTY